MISLAHPETCKLLNLTPANTDRRVRLADTGLGSKLKGKITVDIQIDGHIYSQIDLFLMENCCAPLILGRDFMKKFSVVKFAFGGNGPAMDICALTVAKIEPPRLFSNLSANCRPVRTKSRSYSKEDREFIHSEIERLRKERVIIPSRSPWRAQVLVVKNSSKKRMVVDYSRTINPFTELDGYPLPRISEIVLEYS